MNTTISISKETRNLLQEFGKKSENYDDVIKRMHNTIQMSQMLRDFVNPDEWISIDEALEWTKLKLQNDKNSHNKRAKK
ncbi:MAG: hypothetical protein GXP63_03905 [DPANN group archaeon]|nr:hypothetical protein [DPANN group archaeon]